MSFLQSSRHELRGTFPEHSEHSQTVCVPRAPLPLATSPKRCSHRQQTQGETPAHHQSRVSQPATETALALSTKLFAPSSHFTFHVLCITHHLFTRISGPP